jgi:hypothetical protein
MDPNLPLNPVIYPVMLCATAAAVAVLFVAYALFSIDASIRKRRRAALGKWKAAGLAFVLPPAQASFLNEPRSFGVGSNGTLVLTKHALYFAQVMPEREIVIQLSDIDSVHLVSKFNGRWGGGPFLVLRRKIGDLTGFKISNARRWAEAIDEVRMGKLPLAEPNELRVTPELQTM